jgi:pimeloyl-ACP methyl ester carboxylesterase
VLVLAGKQRQQLLKSSKSRSGSSSNTDLSSLSSVRAVVSQSPHLDGALNRKKNLLPPPQGRGLAGALRLSRAALADLVRSAVGLPPAYVPIVGPRGSVSLMPLPPDELSLYFAKHPPKDALKGGGWQNRAPARLALLVGSYSPIDSVTSIEAPVLFVAATKDALCPAPLVAKAHAACGYGGRNVSGACELLNVDCGHFGLYVGKPFDQAAGAMLSFFKKHLI